MPLPLDEKTIRGFWRIPGNDRKLKGTLSFSETKGIRLELEDNFYPESYSVPPSTRYHEVILGDSGQGAFSLYGCHEGLPDFFTGQCLCSADFVFDGVHFENPEKLVVKKTHVNMSLLHEWAGKTGFTIEGMRGERPIRVTYDHPDSVRLASTSDCTINIDFLLAGLTRTRIQREISLHQVPRLRIEFNNESAWPDVWRKLGRVQLFLAWAVSWPVQVQALDIFTAATQLPIHTYFRTQAYDEIPRFIADEDMLFTLEDVSDGIEGYFAKWLEDEIDIFPVLELYSRDMYDENHLSLELRYLSLIQATEILHSRMFTARQRKLACRLEDMFDIASKVLDDEKWFDGKEVDSFVATRHFIVHRNPDYETKAKKGIELYPMCQTLRALIDLHLLRWLGMDDGNIQKLMRRNRHFRKTLKKP
ncbi:MAG: hypothetical protein PHI18_05060 [bacterium]|nr:hypothetical protein [bacterium]